MTLVFYIPCGDEPAKEYRRRLELLGGLASVEGFDSIRLLGRRLVQLPSGSVVALLMPGDRDDLERLLELAPRLLPVSTVLVAPDQSDATLAMGHRLRPRFLASVENDPEQVLAVTRQLIERQRSRLPPRG